MSPKQDTIRMPSFAHDSCSSMSTGAGDEVVNQDMEPGYVVDPKQQNGVKYHVDSSSLVTHKDSLGSSCRVLQPETPAQMLGHPAASGDMIESNWRMNISQIISTSAPPTQSLREGCASLKPRFCYSDEGGNVCLDTSKSKSDHHFPSSLLHHPCSLKVDDTDQQSPYTSRSDDMISAKEKNVYKEESASPKGSKNVHPPLYIPNDVVASIEYDYSMGNGRQDPHPRNPPVTIQYREVSPLTSYSPYRDIKTAYQRHDLYPMDYPVSAPTYHESYIHRPRLPFPHTVRKYSSPSISQHWYSTTSSSSTRRSSLPYPVHDTRQAYLTNPPHLIHTLPHSTSPIKRHSLMYSRPSLTSGSSVDFAANTSSLKRPSMYSVPYYAPRAPMFVGKYQIVVRQQPFHARMCGCGEKDRRTVDPIQSTEADGNSSSMDYPFFVVRASLWSQDEQSPIIQSHKIPSYMSLLIGNSMESSLLAQDETGQKGVFCVFPDLSVRVEGTFKLKFELYDLGSPAGRLTYGKMLIAHAFSEAFNVYSAKEFTGMLPSSALSKALREQGFRFHIRKDKKEDTA